MLERKRQRMLAVAASTAENASDRDKRDRTRALLEDARGRRDIEVERARGLETKASFVVAVAGLITGSIISDLLLKGQWCFGAAPGVLAALALGFAIHALWPVTIDTPDSAEMKTEAERLGWDAAQLERALLNLTIRETGLRRAAYSRRWQSLKLGYILLVVTLVTYAVAVVILAASR